jgi:hypothetical protein
VVHGEAGHGGRQGGQSGIDQAAVRRRQLQVTVGVYLHVCVFGAAWTTVFEYVQLHLYFSVFNFVLSSPLLRWF